MRKYLSLLGTFWGPVLLFVIGVATIFIGVGAIILLISFIVMPWVVVVHAGKKYGIKMALLATMAIIVPFAAVVLNIDHGFVSADVPDMPPSADHYDEYIIRARVYGMLTVIMAVEPIAYIFLLRKQTISTIIACILCILIWIVGIYFYNFVTLFPHIN